LFKHFGQHRLKRASHFWRIQPRKVNIGVKGLFGCTTIMIVSSQGAYVAHWWEDPDFSDSDREQLKERALRALQKGTQYHPSLVQYADQLRAAAAFLVTPQFTSKARPRYPEHVKLIETAVKDILPDVQFGDIEHD
jgi:hypothetical protein